MVKETAGQEFLLATTSIIYFEHYITLVQQSCCEYYYFLRTLLYLLCTLCHTRPAILLRVLLFTPNIIVLVQLWVAGEGPTVQW